MDVLQGGVVSTSPKLGILFKANSIQPDFPMVSHGILHIQLHWLVHLGSQTKVLYVKLGAQFVLTGHRLISSVLETVKSL